ncbi:MAG: ribonuclease H-like domain-containing protein, partial [Candidatus Uhrbacteria bacterium]
MTDTKRYARDRLVIDIETVGFRWDDIPERVRGRLVKRAKGDEAVARSSLALSPTTGHVVLVGMFNPDTRHGEILVEGPTVLCSEAVGDDETSAALARDGIKLRVVAFGGEGELLKAFWERVIKYGQIVTFNGRSFDGPFLMVRSIVNNVVVRRNLVGNRYADYHLDLMDRLACFGATSSCSLDEWCVALGIPSPKDGHSGADVEQLWNAGDRRALCQYSAGDLRATAALLER